MKSEELLEVVAECLRRRGVGAETPLNGSTVGSLFKDPEFVKAVDTELRMRGLQSVAESDYISLDDDTRITGVPILLCDTDLGEPAIDDPLADSTIEGIDPDDPFLDPDTALDTAVGALGLDDTCGPLDPGATDFELEPDRDFLADTALDSGATTVFGDTSMADTHVGDAPDDAATKGLPKPARSGGAKPSKRPVRTPLKQIYRSMGALWILSFLQFAVLLALIMLLWARMKSS